MTNFKYTKIQSNCSITIADQADGQTQFNITQAIESSKRPKLTLSSPQTSLQSELLDFQRNETLGPILYSVCVELLKVRPASVDPERAFSDCALLLTAKRLSLMSQKIDMVIFIKQNKKLFEPDP